MIARKPKSYQELRDCVEKAADAYTDPLFPVDKAFAVKNAWQLYQTGAMCAIIEHEGFVVAFGLASVGAPYMHSKEKEVQQTYYQTFANGITAVKALICFHEAMIDYAKEKRVIKCTTTSIMPNQEVFYRILAQEGWKRYGCMMVYDLSRFFQRTTQGTPRGAPRPVLREVGRVTQEGTALTPFWDSRARPLV